MAVYEFKKIRKIARANRRPINVYVGGGDAYTDGEQYVNGPASVTVLPYGKTKIKKMSYRLDPWITAN